MERDTDRGIFVDAEAASAPASPQPLPAPDVFRELSAQDERPGVSLSMLISADSSMPDRCLCREWRLLPEIDAANALVSMAAGGYGSDSVLRSPRLGLGPAVTRMGVLQ